MGWYSEEQDRVQSSLVAKYNYDILSPPFISLGVLVHLFFSSIHLHFFLYFLLTAFFLLGLHFPSGDASVLFLSSCFLEMATWYANRMRGISWGGGELRKMIWVTVDTYGKKFCSVPCLVETLGYITQEKGSGEGRSLWSFN